MIDTQQVAYEAAKQKEPTLAPRILAALGTEPDGLTADEIAGRIKESVLSVRPRVSILRAEGKLTDTGLRRRNASGSRAAVWRLS